MRIILNILLLGLFSFSLSACDGFNFDSLNDTDDADRRFTRSELAFNVVFSSLLLNDSGFSTNRDGFIVLFSSSSNLDEIKLDDSDNDSALVGNYPWTIVNNELQVTYPNGVTCTSRKISKTSSQYIASNRCDGGEPNNDRISNTLNIPIAFNEDNLKSLSITIENDDEDQRFEFFSNGNFEIRDLDSNGDEIAGTTEIGVYEDSTDLNNVVTLNNTVSGESSLLVLLEGSLDLGTMLELRYTDITRNTLKEVRIYTIDTNTKWDTDSIYDDIEIDG